MNYIFPQEKDSLLWIKKASTKQYKIGEKRKNRLSDVHIKQHLQQRQTIGVFAGTQLSKFVCFDVDIKDEKLAKLTVYKLAETLQDIGIAGDYIHISLSGNKGYHVEIFFDRLISNVVIKQFYLMILNKSELLNINYGQVELRPTESQGVKLPLGCHWRTGKTCWYVDYENGLQPIEKYDYILTIQQLDSEYFYALMNRHNDSLELSIQESDELEEIKQKYKPLNVYKENIDEQATVTAVEKLLDEGLTMQGTRHNSLAKISKYFKYIGMSKHENGDSLIKWLALQDSKLYRTSWEDCLNDINSIVKWVYESDCSLIVRNMNIEISSGEVSELLKVKGKNTKLVLHAMIIHSKRYALQNGIFYMTFEQMQEATGLTRMTLISIIKKLEAVKMIEVVERNVSQDGTFKKKPNKYRITMDTTIQKNEQKTFKVCERNCKDCFNACLCFMYPKSVLKKILTRREANHISEYQYSCQMNKVG